MPHRTIKLTLAYDGTDFNGWQVQKSGRTVQGVIEEALELMHGRPVRVQGAGRTDSGVHATGQVASFLSNLDGIPHDKFRDALNTLLPPDVRILESRQMDRSFNAKSSARMRIYRYNLYVAEIGLPHLRRYCWKIRWKPDVERLNRMAAAVVGEHDFTTFATAGDSSRSKVRVVYSAAFYPEAPFLVFRIAASSFLWKMVRSLLGTMLEFEQNNREVRLLEEALRAKDRSLAGATAPARGLFLERIRYDDSLTIC